VQAEELAEVLDEFLSGAERLGGPTQGGTGGRPGQGEGGGGGGGASARTSNEVIVVPDASSNALLIAANKTRYEEVLELMSRRLEHLGVKVEKRFTAAPPVSVDVARFKRCVMKPLRRRARAPWKCGRVNLRHA